MQWIKRKIGSYVLLILRMHMGVGLVIAACHGMHLYETWFVLPVRSIMLCLHITCTCVHIGEGGTWSWLIQTEQCSKLYLQKEIRSILQSGACLNETQERQRDINHSAREVTCNYLQWFMRIMYGRQAIYCERIATQFTTPVCETVTTQYSFTTVSIVIHQEMVVCVCLLWCFL